VSDSNPSGSKPSGSKPSGSNPSGSKPSGSKPSGSNPSGSKPSGSKPSGSKPSGSKPSGSKPSGSNPSGSKPSGSKPSGSNPSGSKPSGPKPSGSNPSGSKPSGSNPSGSKSSESIQFIAWFGTVDYEPKSGFSAKPRKHDTADPDFLADDFIAVSSALSPEASANIRNIQSIRNNPNIPNIQAVSFLKPSAVPEKPDYRKLASDAGLADSDSEYLSLLRNVAIRSARKQLSAALSEDKKVTHSVEALNDLNETINHLTERLTEWYSVYYPELDLPGDAYVRFVSEIPESASQSLMGAPANEEDLRMLQGFAGDILSLYERKAAVELFISDKMKETAPNLSQVAGVVLGARLLSMAGGLKNLAAMPSGSIQVMGAEKAMVKHLRANAPSPKHGIIFSHPVLNTAPFKARGKIARAFASAISLAARTDYYSGVFKPEIESDFNLKAVKIKQNVSCQKAEGPK